jgi:hypothetical protein
MVGGARHRLEQAEAGAVQRSGDVSNESRCLHFKGCHESPQSFVPWRGVTVLQ